MICAKRYNSYEMPQVIPIGTQEMLHPSSGKIPAPMDGVGRKPESAGRTGDLQTRGDLRRLILQLWEPLLALSSASKARCCPGVTGAVYGNATAELEGFCRPLWAVAACSANGELLPGTEFLSEAITAGVDPLHADFWGNCADGDQRCVEMAVLGWALGKNLARKRENNSLTG